MTQLAAFVAAGGRITLGRLEFTLDGVAEDDDIKVATFRGPRATYTGVVSINAVLPGRPGAEVWSIVGSRSDGGWFRHPPGPIHSPEVIQSGEAVTA